MEPSSTQPIDFFHDHYDLSPSGLERALAEIYSARVDYGDLYFEYSVSEALSLEEGMVKKATRNVSQGVGVRALAGERTGYAYSDEITVENLRLAARTARAIADQGGTSAPVPIQGRYPSRNLYPVAAPVTDAPLAGKIALLQEVDRIARAYDARIINVMASFACEHKTILIVTSEGLEIGDVQPLCRLQVTCIAEERGARQVGTYGGGGRLAYDAFLKGGSIARYAREASRQAILNLSAVPAPAGFMDVVLGPGWPGILLHEAVGHGLEGDFNRKRTSAFTDRIGRRVATELCTVVDDGTLPNRRGSINVDDEGTPTGQNVLIEKGVLRGYLQDRLNARLMNLPLTGNGRRESYAHFPIPRMTNTFLLAGEDDPQDIIRSVKSGLYAVAFGGGQVDITNGKFVFSATEAYRIEDGRITAPVKGATLVGNGPDVLTRVVMVGNDLKLDEGVGTCGKDGQSVPVGVGLPTLKIQGITVGGTEG